MNKISGIYIKNPFNLFKDYNCKTKQDYIGIIKNIVRST